VTLKVPAFRCTYVAPVTQRPHAVYAAWQCSSTVGQSGVGPNKICCGLFRANDICSGFSPREARSAFACKPISSAASTLVTSQNRDLTDFSDGMRFGRERYSALTSAGLKHSNMTASSLPLLTNV
jgi:hypothetical protein